MPDGSNGGSRLVRAHKFVASWWHIYRTGDFVTDFKTYRPLRGWRRLRMATRIWALYGYGKDFHLR